jgi:hypothetical protein
MWKILINIFIDGHNYIKIYLKSVSLKDFTTYFDVSGHDQVVIFVGEETDVYLQGTWFMKIFIFEAIFSYILRNCICF